MTAAYFRYASVPDFLPSHVVYRLFAGLFKMSQVSVTSQRLAVIDLERRTFRVEQLDPQLTSRFLGGRGLAARLLMQYAPRGCDPLGPENPLIISAGLLTGTMASASARVNFAARSPLTGLLGSSNMGGGFGPELRWAGFEHLVIRGRASEPLWLYVRDGKVEFFPAARLWGQGVYQTRRSLYAEIADPRAQVLCIGPAGENQVRFACIMGGIKSAAGRTGMGAVMGSKNLKAIVCRGRGDLPIARPEKALEYNRRVIGQVVSSKVSRVMQRWGTAFIFDVTNTTGLVRTRNFQYNQLPRSEDLECEAMEPYSQSMAACFGCQVHCRHRYRLASGPYRDFWGQGPEYSSLGAFGTEVGCRSMRTVLECNHLVNDLGLDTIETGSMIAWAMELYEKGILTRADTGGLELGWGNDRAVAEMIRQIAYRRHLGDILARGPLPAAEAIGKDSRRYLIQVKGMSSLHSDERPTPSLALNIAVASRGADHLRGRPAIDLYNLPLDLLEKVYRRPDGYDGPLVNDWTSYRGKARMVMWQEILYMLVDSLGICKFHTVFFSPNHPAFEEFSQLVEYNTGLELSARQLWTAGWRCCVLERIYNLDHGLARDDDWLPDRFFDEPTPLGLPVARGKCLDREKFAAMVSEYYRLYGLDRDGRPSPELLNRLGLSGQLAGHAAGGGQ